MPKIWIQEFGKILNKQILVSKKNEHNPQKKTFVKIQFKMTENCFYRGKLASLFEGKEWVFKDMRSNDCNETSKI